MTALRTDAGASVGGEEVAVVTAAVINTRPRLADLSAAAIVVEARVRVDARPVTRKHEISLTKLTCALITISEVLVMRY